MASAAPRETFYFLRRRLLNLEALGWAFEGQRWFLRPDGGEERRDDEGNRLIAYPDRVEYWVRHGDSAKHVFHM